MAVSASPTMTYGARALWDLGVPTTTLPMAKCTPFTLSADVIITLGTTSTVTLSSNGVFTPQCTMGADTAGLDLDSNDSTDFSPQDMRDPFYKSTLPVSYALGCTTIIAYMLVIMLFITPRSFVSGGMVILGRRGFANGPSGGESGIGVGGRPWLQKIAALTVAISLTIATVNTFSIAQDQYDNDLLSATILQQQVMNGLELKVMRVISDTFLWLAQAQTLIRLFPRHREKIIIKWTALALISLNLLFSILNQFVYTDQGGSAKPTQLTQAIPALSYLFHLALSLLYCAWVMYYSLLKKKYAFYHPQMRNICLLALIALVSILVPVVFFVVDICNKDVAIWGDYVRWVGAAAASVVVWEWVERIEALERNDKKDGVLGREVFDGDEMLEVTPSTNIAWTQRLRRAGGGTDGGGGTATGTGSKPGSAWPAMSGLAQRYRPLAMRMNNNNNNNINNNTDSSGDNNNTGNVQQGVPAQKHRLQNLSPQLPTWPSRPPAVATSVSRTDTGSAESTVYAVRYHPISEGSEHRPDLRAQERQRAGSFDIEAQSNGDAEVNGEREAVKTPSDLSPTHVVRESVTARAKVLQSLEALNPFTRQRQTPPAVVSANTTRVKETPPSQHPDSTRRWDVIGRLEDFASTQAERILEKTRPSEELVSALPITRIPAPPRRRTLQEISEELDREETFLETGSSPLVSGDDAVSRVAPSSTRTGSQASPVLRRSHTTPGPVESTTAAVIRRGTLSFAAATHSDWESREHDALDTLVTDTSQQTPAVPTTRSPLSSVQEGSLHTRSTVSATLPVLRIPAPPRPRRPAED